MTQFIKNLLSAYNEALDNNRMSEETARTEIEKKYGVKFTSWNNNSERFTEIQTL